MIASDQLSEAHPSYWWRTREERERSTRLVGFERADFCIVGAGFSGLWTAYWLNRWHPDARIVVIDARFPGFGASGRNTGWLSGKLVGTAEAYVRLGDGGRHLLATAREACRSVPAEVHTLLEELGIDCDAMSSGYLSVARSRAAVGRLKKGLLLEPGGGVEWLEPDALAERVHVAGARGAVYSQYCTVLDPMRLLLGLASYLRKRGVVIFEESPVAARGPALVASADGQVQADSVLWCTETYGELASGRRTRKIVPIEASMAITDPLDEVDRQRIGWRDRVALSTAENNFVYAQLTSDHRIAFGGGGMRYHWGSRLSDHPPTRTEAEELLRSLFPGLSAGVQRTWSGFIGLPRDGLPSLQFDRATGRGAVGGYAGHGLAGSYLAGKALAELAADQEPSPLSQIWRDASPRRWEPEPARWAGIHISMWMFKRADAVEGRNRSDRASLYGRCGQMFTGL